MIKKYKKVLFIFGTLSFMVFFYIIYNVVIHNFNTHAFTDSELYINENYLLNRTSAHSFNLVSVKEQRFVIEPTIKEFNYNKKFIIASSTNMSGNKDDLYWIIDMEMDKIYGPLDEKNFLSTKTELSLKLQLKSVYNFFK